MLEIGYLEGVQRGQGVGRGEVGWGGLIVSRYLEKIRITILQDIRRI